jgi:hypothetical protein
MRNERCGARKSRKIGSRVPDLGYYQIITDTDKTERHYFEGLRDSIPEYFRNRIVIKVEKEKTIDLVKKAIELRDMTHSLECHGLFLIETK